MDTGGGEPRAPGHPCLTETVQQVLDSCSGNSLSFTFLPKRSSMASNSGLSDLPKLSLSWLPRPSQGTAFPIEILLFALI